MGGIYMSLLFFCSRPPSLKRTSRTHSGRAVHLDAHAVLKSCVCGFDHGSESCERGLFVHEPAVGKTGRAFGPF